MEHFDVMIVGAGLSGIGAACRTAEAPAEEFRHREGRTAMGGTWDLFRYPGVRSDSDMYTLGYRFRPWRDAKAIADGPAILNYIRETAAEFGVDQEIRYGHRVRRASWLSADALWTVEAETGSDKTPEKTTARFTCRFLYLCTGYYDYEGGYTPDWSGVKRFRGQIVHPQKWPESLDYEGKRVVVIGSGATAVTLVPAMAERAAHVTMLQRSPTYVVSRPGQDKLANWARRLLPDRAAYALTRWKNVLLQMFFYRLARWRPDVFKRMLRKGVRNHLGEQYDIKHFTPQYNPWDQRLCLVPDSDLFNAIRDGRASVVTDYIETFTETGLQLTSGEHLDADIIVTATGLVLKLMSGLQLVVDGAPVDLSKTMAYKGMMYSDVPNLALWLHERVLDFEVRPHGRVRLSSPEVYGRARLRAVHPARERSPGHGGARTRLHLRLRAEGAPHAAAAGIEDAVALTPKLREGPLYASVRARGRRDNGVQDGGAGSGPHRCGGGPAWLSACAWQDGRR